MLSHIHIRDFAIVEAVDLDLQSGMTVLSGETGAGKSILIDALGLALGDRADSSSVRHGAERAEISVEFDLADAEAATAWLQANELDADGECLIRRTVTAEGRSKAYINGSPVPLQQLKTLGEHLVDIHGQHAHQSLMQREEQRRLLDAYAAQTIKGHKATQANVSSLAQQWKRLNAEYQALRQAAAEREARLDLLRYQVNELDELALDEDEVGHLETEHARLANTGRLLEEGRGCLDSLHENDEHAVTALLGQISRELEELAQVDTTLAPALELVNGALIQAREGADELRRYLDRLDLDPERLQQVDERLAALHTLARKHHVVMAGLPELHNSLRQELADLEQAGMRLEGMETELAALVQAYRAAAAELSKGRARAAKALGKTVSETMDELGMPGGRFEVNLEAVADDEISAHGQEQVGFLVSANPGTPPKPLSRVASGGELSRISLAIQVKTAGSARIPTLIFDEVDSGIGGAVAETVGRKLRAVGEGRQVLCVTHLPQVASQGHHHLQVSKSTDRKTTQTRIEALQPDSRVDEIARMLGGLEITAQTRAHAEEMIRQAG